MDEDPTPQSRPDRDADPDSLDWPELWHQQGPEPADLVTASTEALTLARTGRWRPNETDCHAGVRLRDVLLWTEQRPLGPTVGEVQLVFAEVLRSDLSPPMRALLTAAARWEPAVPRPGSWGETLVAVITGDLTY